MKFEFVLWTPSLIGEVIYRKFRLLLTKPSVERVMRILGRTPQKPKYAAWQHYPVLLDAWKPHTFPALKAEAKKKGAIIYFAGESGVRSDHRAGTSWAPCGETPVVEATGRRFGLNTIYAVGGQGEFRFIIQEGTVNSELFR